MRFEPFARQRAAVVFQSHGEDGFATTLGHELGRIDPAVEGLPLPHLQHAQGGQAPAVFIARRQVPQEVVDGMQVEFGQ